jgi:hypothetical protein
MWSEVQLHESQVPKMSTVNKNRHIRPHVTSTNILFLLRSKETEFYKLYNESDIVKVLKVFINT